MTASNLFKYCQPAHGLVLFKHHQPLEFNLEQLSDLLQTAQGWFDVRDTCAPCRTPLTFKHIQPIIFVSLSPPLTPQTASAAHPEAQHPLLIWNVLHRAGASQYHGHAQVLLSDAPFPTPAAHAAAAAAYQTRHGVAALDDQLAVADALGLLQCVKAGPPGGEAVAWVAPALAPSKDMEVVVHGGQGAGLDCPALHVALFFVLRALIDVLGVQTWNLAVYNVPLARHAPERIVVRCVYDYVGDECGSGISHAGWFHEASWRRWRAILGPLRCLEGRPLLRQTHS